uniref:Uncharacterized protein n=1 Tax=Streptomyces avermitilis TaxID=33903 RepID=A0A499V4M1_STRAX|nr:hypothetical protein SAVMC3_20640 [Streptomyces avermitilis]
MPGVAGVGAGRDEVDVVAAADGRVLGVDGPAVRVDGVHQGQARLEDVVLAGPVEGQSELPSGRIA